MLRGIYVAASGLLASETVATVAAANLAAGEVPGYKAEEAVLTPFGQMLLEVFSSTGLGQVLGSSLPLGVVAEGSAYDRAEGPLVQTGRGLDVAVQGPGFLAVATPAGPRYTRDGALGVDALGELVDAAGDPVLGVGGQAIRGLDQAASIGPNGTVLDHGRPMGRIALFDLPAAAQESGAFFTAARAAPDVTSSLLPGFLEGSNTSQTQELTQAMAALAAYQANSSALAVENTTLGTAVTQVGLVG